MKDDRIPKDIHTELEYDKINFGHLQLGYKDVCKRDMRAIGLISAFGDYTVTYCDELFGVREGVNGPP